MKWMTMLVARNAFQWYEARNVWTTGNSGSRKQPHAGLELGRFPARLLVEVP